MEGKRATVEAWLGTGARALSLLLWALMVLGVLSGRFVVDTPEELSVWTFLTGVVAFQIGLRA